MNNLMDTIIQKDFEQTQVVDAQLNCLHKKTVSIASAGIYQCLDCGRTFEEGETI